MAIHDTRIRVDWVDPVTKRKRSTDFTTRVEAPSPMEAYKEAINFTYEKMAIPKYQVKNMTGRGVSAPAPDRKIDFDATIDRRRKAPALNNKMKAAAEKGNGNGKTTND